MLEIVADLGGRYGLCLLAIGAGNTIYMYTVSQGVQEDLAIQVHRGSLPATDTTGLVFLPTIGATRQMLITDMSWRCGTKGESKYGVGHGCQVCS